MNKNNKEIDKDGLNEVIHLSKNLLKIFYIVTLIAIFLGIIIAVKELKLLNFFGGILKVLSPVFIGFVIAWLFYPLHKKMIDKGINKVVSSLIIALCLIAIIFIFIYVFIPVLYNQVNDFVSSVPDIYNGMTNFVTNSINKINISGIDITSIKNNMVTMIEDTVVGFTQSIPGGIIVLLKNLFSAVGTILMSFIVAIYMLIDFDNITVIFHKLLPNKEYIKLCDNIGKETRKVVNGTLLVALLVFIFDTIGFALAGLNSAFLFGLLCGITDLIPYVGPYIGGAAAVIVAFTQSPVVGICVLVVAVIVQLLENYILQPVVMSKAMSLSPLTIIAGLLLFGYIGGIGAMIIATPCIAILKEIFNFFIHRKKA